MKRDRQNATDEARQRKIMDRLLAEIQQMPLPDQQRLVTLVQYPWQLPPFDPTLFFSEPRMQDPLCIVYGFLSTKELGALVLSAALRGAERDALLRTMNGRKDRFYREMRNGLLYLMRKNQLSAVKVIVNHPEFDKDPIPYALRAGCAPILSYLLGLGRWQPTDYLYYRKVPVPMIRCLLEHGADVKNWDETIQGSGPLSFALRHTLIDERRLQLAELLLEFGADAYERKWCGTGVKPPLYWAVKACDVAVTKLLLRHYDGKPVQRGIREMAELTLLNNTNVEFTQAHRVIFEYEKNLDPFSILKLLSW